MFKDLCPPKVGFFQRHCPLNYKYATPALARLVVVVPGILAKVQRCSFSPQKAAEYVMENVFSRRPGPVRTKILTLWQVHSNLTVKRNLSLETFSCFYQVAKVICHALRLILNVTVFGEMHSRKKCLSEK